MRGIKNENVSCGHNKNFSLWTHRDIHATTPGWSSRGTTNVSCCFPDHLCEVSCWRTEVSSLIVVPLVFIVPHTQGTWTGCWTTWSPVQILSERQVSWMGKNVRRCHVLGSLHGKLFQSSIVVKWWWSMTSTILVVFTQTILTYWYNWYNSNEKIMNEKLDFFPHWDSPKLEAMKEMKKRMKVWMRAMDDQKRSFKLVAHEW